MGRVQLFMVNVRQDKSFLEVASPLLENFAVACAAPGGLEKDVPVAVSTSSTALVGWIRDRQTIPQGWFGRP